MKRTLARIGLFLLAGLAGWGASELVSHTKNGREAIAHFSGTESAFRLETNLRQAAAGESIDENEVSREMDLFRDEFGDAATLATELRSANLSLGEMREEVRENLRARAWIEKQIAPQLPASAEEIAEFYDAHRELFTQPLRERARHLFLAAPQDAPAGVVAVKQSEILGLSVRLLAGEKFPALVAEASEDEASKMRGGDLGYFAERRMPPEFIAEIRKMQVGETSAPLRSHLGFHIVQLTEEKPAHELSPEEARPEIARAIVNRKRALAVGALVQRLGAADFAAAR
ncbi:MAG: peptidylprolyl isomerase [Verrucomicrobiota bacterium]|nr:peptidylprolyl isomerase [Verrucomicrobiota bacterium]